MTATDPPQNLPLAAGIEEEELEAEGTTRPGETVGASDAEADEARSRNEAPPADVARDSDRTPVGDADLEADKRASGA